MSDAIGDATDRQPPAYCAHGYPRRLCLACKTESGPKGGEAETPRDDVAERTDNG